MKKQQKTFNWDQSESSDELDGDVLDGLEGLDDFDDEEIIDLSEGDIVEEDSGESIMDDFGSGDLMEPDDDAGLGLGDLGSAGSKPRPHSITDEDLMDEMAGVDEDLGLGDDESLEVRILDEEDVAEAEAEAEAEAGGDEEMDFSDLMGLLDDAPGEHAREEGEDEPLGEAPEAEGLFDAAPVEEAAPGDDPVEELIARIESRLEDVVRRVVEARLPEIVREALREEIERLKQ